MNKLKLLSIIGSSVFSLSLASAQNGTPLCGTGDSTQIALFKRPDIKAKIDELERFTADFTAKNNHKKAGQQKIVIPMVFHIIYNNDGAGNISKEQVLDAVRVVNEDYHKQNADTSETVDQFKSIAAKIDIEFRIATIDPDGNCTEGITRTLSAQTDNAGEGVKELVSWDTHKYLNVWVVNNIPGAGGYAYYPGTAPKESYDGVLIRNTQFGSIGTSSAACDLCAGSLTHEIGHYLNLKHTWGDSNTPGADHPENCDVDDDVTDTPECAGASGCNLYTDNACGPLANEQNYMDYAGCYTMFTEGQKARMLAALNSTIGSRLNLWSDSNLLATGVEDNHTILACIPTAEFDVSKTIGCEGSTIQFTDQSYNAQPSTYKWLFPGGTPSTSSDANPSITYNTGGLYDATLITGSASGNDTIIKKNVVRIGSAFAPAPYPFNEAFTTSNFGSNGWYADNTNTDNVFWANAAAGHNGNGSIKLNNTNTGSARTGSKDNLISPPIDFTGISKPVFTFYDAYINKASGSNGDALKIYYSANCGETWSIIKNLTATNLLSATNVSSFAFTPISSTVWKMQTVTSAAYANKSNIIFKFEYTNSGTIGNNLYLDDINWGASVTGIGEENALNSLNLEMFPNPTDKETTISFNLDKANVVKIEVFDILGRNVAALINEKLDTGNHKVEVNSITEKGIYFVKLNIGSQQLVSKLIVN